MFNINPLLQTDFYKVDHRRQYPAGTNLVYSNLTARSDHLSPCASSPFYDGKMVIFGIQYFVKYIAELFQENFFNCPKEQMVTEYKNIIEAALGKDAITYEHIAELHDLGYLPIIIKALPEGTRVKMKVPFLTIVNTHPNFFWVTNFLETILSANVWKLCTNATIAFEYKKILTHYADKTGSDKAFIPFQGHDFSFRGMSGNIDAAMSGMAHLTSFVGTDTIPAIDMVQYYYNIASKATLIGCSVPATEHSVMCLNSQDTEINTFKRLITETYPTGIVSIVSDTWDFWKVITEYLVELKPIIMARNGKVVIRPDSGNPVDIICGLPITDISKLYNKLTIESAQEIMIDYIVDSIRDNTPHGERGTEKITEIFKFENIFYSITIEIEWNRYDKQYYFVDGYNLIAFEKVILTAEQNGAIEALWNIFGGTINDKGYKVLDSHIGLIYGDSITLERANEILKRLEAKGFASSNIVFGIGSYTYQYSTRDSFGMAVKSTYGEVCGEAREIFKSPKTDSGIKNSAKGILRVDIIDGEYVLSDQVSYEDEAGGELKIVFADGEYYNQTSLAHIRDNLNKQLTIAGKLKDN